MKNKHTYYGCLEIVNICKVLSVLVLLIGLLPYMSIHCFANSSEVEDGGKYIGELKNGKMHGQGDPYRG